MQDSHKPDLDDSLNVTESHDRLMRDAAAVAREKRVNDGGREPVSNWIFAAGGVIAISAGLALGNAGGLFDYDDIVAPGYVRESLNDGSDSGPPPMDALKAYMAKGEKVYSKCVGCHGPDGKGSAAYPSLVGSAWALGETERFSMIVLNGLSGPTSYDKTYGVMPAQGVGMSPTDLATVMTYVRNSFGNETGDVITTEMAAKAIEISEGRSNAGAPVTGEELAAEHLKELPGDPLDPTTQVDPVSLAPVE